ncbi:hypothetical protein [Agrobacterium tumefaciens]|uniref:hypothetical protein n=1 Tax=Agrobacterium tumefaciens TaxID=358 RepID=UPI001BA5E2CE|nr:hypothetical protein [Agrobacterium tumefaciens]WCK01170.1 hypothetical protein G6L31_007780 [Agrobacterium tumefaciens]
MLSQIFNAMADGAAFCPSQIARTLNGTHQRALARLVERIEMDEIKEEDLQVLWRAHHASDQFFMLAPIADLLGQISRHLQCRQP